MAFLIVIHVIACLGLIFLILVQRGRGGGLVDAFSGVDAMFGPKTNAFLSRTTSTLAIVFFLTCLSLALLSSRQSRSLMQGVKPAPSAQPAEKDNTPQAAQPAPAANQSASEPAKTQ